MERRSCKCLCRQVWQGASCTSRALNRGVSERRSPAIVGTASCASKPSRPGPSSTCFSLHDKLRRGLSGAFPPVCLSHAVALAHGGAAAAIGGPKLLFLIPEVAFGEGKTPAGCKRHRI